jgi:hypothetical protein
MAKTPAEKQQRVVEMLSHSACPCLSPLSLSVLLTTTWSDHDELLDKLVHMETELGAASGSQSHRARILYLQTVRLPSLSLSLSLYCEVLLLSSCTIHIHILTRMMRTAQGRARSPPQRQGPDAETARPA